MIQAFNPDSFKIDLFLTPKDLADILGITVQALHKFLKENNIETRVGNTRFHRIYPHQTRQILALRGLTYPKQVINLHNVKGGVGKSTCTHALATRAAAYGARVLMIDIDQQANLTGSFGIHGHPKAFPTVMSLIEGTFAGKKMEPEDAVIKITENLHLLPSNLSMANLDTQLSLDSTFNLTTFFEQILSPISDNYDLIFIDSPPALSKLTSAAHFYSDIVLMPVEPDKFSLDGLELNFEHIARLKKNFGAKATEMIFINKYDARPKIDFLIVSELAADDYGDKLCETAVRYASGLKSAIAEGKCVWNTDKKNVALDDLNSLFLEISDIRDRWATERAQKLADDRSLVVAKEVTL